MNTVQEAVKVLLSSLCMEMRETTEFSERQSFFFFFFTKKKNMREK